MGHDERSGQQPGDGWVMMDSGQQPSDGWVMIDSGQQPGDVWVMMKVVSSLVMGRS